MYVQQSNSQALQNLTNHLNAKHYQELIEKRSLALDWVSSNCKSVSVAEATEVLGYPAKSVGLLIQGTNWQIQFKPDKPWISNHDKANGRKKAPKYRTPQEYEGGYDAILPMHPESKDYWHNLQTLRECAWKVDSNPYIVITEGGFKAIAGCSNGIPTIGLLGVEMGLTSAKADPQGKRYLIDSLERLARAGFSFIFAFDADCAENEYVLGAEKKLTYQLKKFEGVHVLSVTGLWAVENGKGMDDFIKNQGIEEFRQVLSKAFERNWEKLEENKKKASKPPSPRQVGLEIAEEYQPLWAFHNEQKVWRIFNKRYWEDIEDEAFHQVLFNVIEARGVEWEFPVYVDNVMRVLKDKLLIRHWTTFDRTRYIAFNNKVLDTQTGKLLDHSAGYRFTSCLPYDYSILTDVNKDAIALLHQHCPNIYEFMTRAMDGDIKRVMKLLGIVNAVLKFRFFDLQLFVHLVGKPGTGKGTFARMLEEVAGSANTKNSSLTALSEPTELAAIVDKQLVIFPDERRQVGVEELLKLTGGDKIRYREIYKKPGESYFYGMLLVLSNNPVFAGDTTGLERRLCLAQFANPIPKHLRSSTIEQLYKAEIPKIISIALSLHDSQVTSLLKGLGNDEIPEFKKQEWLMKMQVSSLAAWANENVIHALDTSTPIGDGRKGDDGYDIKTLYGNYRDFCDVSGIRQPFQLQTFSGTLIDLCTDLLEWEGIEKRRTNSGLHIKGLRLRANWDGDIPRIDESFKVSVDQCRPSADPSVDLKPLQDKESVDRVGKIENIKSKQLCDEATAQNVGAAIEKESSEVCTSTQPSQHKASESTLGATQLYTEPTHPENLQLKLLTIITILDIISTETEPYFEREETISGVVTVCSYEESWEGIERTFELVELSEIEKKEVKRRLVELGHGARIRQLFEQSQQKAAQPERLFKSGDRVQFQHWYGRFAAYVKSGCLVEWDKMPKSLLKMYGKAPAHPVSELELVLIKKANVLPEQ
jgi:putative DNA primase/helicase